MDGPSQCAGGDLERRTAPSTWIEQLFLAERLQPNPPLIPASIEEQVLMFGYCNELCGENGFGWSKRLTMIHATETNSKTDDATRDGIKGQVFTLSSRERPVTY